MNNIRNMHYNFTNYFKSRKTTLYLNFYNIQYLTKKDNVNLVKLGHYFFIIYTHGKAKYIGVPVKLFFISDIVTATLAAKLIKLLSKSTFYQKDVIPFQLKLAEMYYSSLYTMKKVLRCLYENDDLLI